MTILLLIAFALLVLQSVFAYSNLLVWPRTMPATPESPQVSPLVSVLIPARNEERHIEACIRSLSNQTYPNFELICLDDRSTDGTSDILRRLEATESRLRVLAGRPLEPGWFGKAHACHQLAQAATGSWLVFIDADTTWQPDTLQRVIATAAQRHLDLLTGFPRVISTHLLGWLVTSMMVVTIAFHLPVRLVETSRDARFVAACGMLMCFSTSAYERIGGHQLSGQHLVEDMALARSAKVEGLRVGLVDVSDMGAVDMYENASAVVNGYAKNLYAGVGRRPGILVALIVYYAFLFVFPPVVLLSMLAVGGLTGHLHTLATELSAACVALAIACKAMIDRRFGVPMRFSFLFCGSVIAMLYIAVYSAKRSMTGRGYEWKGRRYG